ncbi:MAG: N5-glutamine methyltransferase family protein, partial [Bradyrhizobium sp.]
MTPQPGQSVETVRRALAARFRAAGSDSSELDARLLMGAALALDLTGLVRSAARRLTEQEMDRIEGFARRRLKGEPVARILGEREFWSLKLQLSPETLVPRPDTETVVELALEMLGSTSLSSRPLRILDIGTGSGAILLALLSERRQAFGIGTDIS